jgi:dTDP-4-amino-4,6-dideoxygalactose transaminase
MENRIQLKEELKKMRKISSAFPYFDEENLQAILRDIETVLKNGVLTDGSHVGSFEKEFADYVGVKYAVAVNSGTAALEIVLRHYGLKGREVIVPTNTFVATPNTVLFAGGKPVFADIREDTLCIDPEDVKRKISSKTAGVVVVHIAGLVCPQMRELRELCEDHGLFIIEDAAHAHGATFDGKKAGSLADAGCFSFYSTKVMTTGEGGMITTDDKRIAEVSVCLRSHGQDARRMMVMLGHNWRMTEIAAILGRHQLSHIEEFVAKRNQLARRYEARLASVKGLSLFKTPSNIRHSFYKFPTRVDDGVDVEKLGLVLKRDYGVETGNVYYPPCHMHPFYRENYGMKEGDLPVSERVLRKVMCLPMHVGLSVDDADYVSDSVRCAIGKLEDK